MMSVVASRVRFEARARGGYTITSTTPFTDVELWNRLRIHLALAPSNPGKSLVFACS